MLVEKCPPDCRIHVSRNDPSVRRYLGLSPLPDAVVRRLNVDHLSTGMGDHRYVWRSSLDGRLIRWNPDSWFGGSWYGHQSHDIWIRIANVAVGANDGERFIRVGQVI